MRLMTIAPARAATSAVRSVEPSFMTMTSTSSTPGILRGTPAITCAIVFSSFRAGIVTTSFILDVSPNW